MSGYCSRCGITGCICSEIEASVGTEYAHKDFKPTAPLGRLEEIEKKLNDPSYYHNGGIPVPDIEYLLSEARHAKRMRVVLIRQHVEMQYYKNRMDWCQECSMKVIDHKEVHQPHCVIGAALSGTVTP